MGPYARGEEERLLYWNREIEASRAAKTRCFLAGYSLMQNRPAAATCCGGRCLRWCCVCFPAALLAAAAAPAAAAAAAAPTATPFAGGLHLLLQCFPGFLLFPLWCFLYRRPCSSPPSHSKIRSSNRHAVALGNRKRRRHRRPFSRAARPGAISFLQEVNLYREIEATKRAF